MTSRSACGLNYQWLARGRRVVRIDGDVERLTEIIESPPRNVLIASTTLCRCRRSSDTRRLLVDNIRYPRTRSVKASQSPAMATNAVGHATTGEADPAITRSIAVFEGS